MRIEHFAREIMAIRTLFTLLRNRFGCTATLRSPYTGA